jgi:hypothetical protein
LGQSAGFSLRETQPGTIATSLRAHALFASIEETDTARLRLPAIPGHQRMINSALPSVEPSLTKSNSHVDGRSASISSRARSSGKTFASFKKGMMMLSSGRFMLSPCFFFRLNDFGRYGFYSKMIADLGVSQQTNLSTQAQLAYGS